MKNTFKITSWDEVPYLELHTSAKFSRAKVVKEYSGEICGEGQLEYLLAYNTSGSAYFTGIEHFTGTVNNRHGSVTIVHEGTFVKGSVKSSFRFLDGSQTEALIGLNGTGHYKTEHSTTVNYNLAHSFIN